MPTTQSLRRTAAHLWGPMWRLSLAIVLGLLFFIITWMIITQELEATGRSLEDRMGLLFLDLMSGLVAVTLYPMRRRWPLLIVGLIVVLATFSSAAAPAAVMAMVSLSTRRRPVEIAVISGLSLTSGFVNSLLHPVGDPAPLWVTLLMLVVLVALPILVGMYIGSRRQLLAALHERAEQLQREQTVVLETARLEERSRIARDMHDSLAHRLSLVSLHAGALEFRTDLSSEETKTAAGIVRENARLASGDLREVLSVLRDQDGHGSSSLTRPDPSVMQSISLLVHEHTAAGSPASLTIAPRVAASIEEMPSSMRPHVTRVIQEGLTNARKHAGGSPVAIRIDGKPGRRLTLSLTNALAMTSTDGAGSEPGFGLVGLSERARIAGGELITRTDGGNFTLTAWFPWTKR